MQQLERAWQSRLERGQVHTRTTFESTVLRLARSYAARALELVDEPAAADAGAVIVG